MTKALTTTKIVALLQDIADLRQEHFICFSLDPAGKLIAKRTVFIGTLTATLVHPREVYADPLADRAAAIIIAHNHPSGNAQPSEGDISTTQQLIAAGLILGIPLHDHIIIARKQHFSFQKHGLIEVIKGGCVNGLRTEDSILGVNTSLSADIAKRLADHLPVGKVVIVSRQPAALLASTRKQWLKLLRQAQRQRSSTLDASKIHKLTQKIAMMQQIRFAAGSLLEEVEADVVFATAEQLLTFPPDCLTMYVATPTAREVLYRITGFMPRGGSVVIYRLAR